MFIKIKYFILYFFLKIIYKFSNKINYLNFYDFLSFNLVGSNHPKRLDLIKDKLLSKTENSKNKLFFLKEQKNLKDTIFFGDSHVEFLGRVIEKKNIFLPKQTLSLWLGPRTIIGLNNNENLTHLRKKINFINKLKKKKFTLVLSLGSIDVRCLYYEIIFRKLVNKQEDVYHLFEKNLLLFINELKKINFHDNKCIFIGLFNSKDKGYEAKNIDDLINFKQNNDFPTLGSFSDRDDWTKKINQIIERVSKQNLIDFIRIDHLTNDLKKDEVLDDNVHLVSKKLFEQIYERINIINGVK